MSKDKYDKEFDAMTASPDYDSEFDKLNARQHVEQPEVLNPQKGATEAMISDKAGYNSSIRAALEFAGMMTGAGRGGALALRTLPSLAKRFPDAVKNTGRVIGSTAGGAGGAAGGQALMNTMLPSVDHVDLGTAAKEGATAGLLGEVGGQLVIGGVNKLLRPVGNKITGGPVTPEQLKLLDDSDSMGITLRPAEATGKASAQQIEQLSKRSLFGRDAAEQLNLSNQTAIKKKADDTATKFFGVGNIRPKEVVGQVIKDAIEGKAVPMFKETIRPMYTSLVKMAPHAKVDTAPLYAQFQHLRDSISEKQNPIAHDIVSRALARISEPGPVTGLNVKRTVMPGQPAIPGTPGARTNSFDQPDVPATPGVPGTKDKLGRLEVEQTRGGAFGNVSQAPNQPKRLDFMEAHDIRSDLLRLNRADPNALQGREAALAGHLAKQMHEMMEVTAKGISPEFHTAWRAVDTFVREGHDLFGDAAIKAALKANPEDVVKASFQKDAQEETAKVMQALRRSGDADAVLSYRYGAMQQLVTKATNDGALNPQALWAASYGPNGVGEKVMKNTFDPAFLAEWNKFLNVARRTNASELPASAGNPIGTARGVINWMEQTMILRVPSVVAQNLVRGDLSGAVSEGVRELTNVTSYVFTQKQLARVLNSTEGVRILREGLTMQPTSQRWARGFTRLIGIAGAQSGTADAPAPVPAAPVITPDMLKPTPKALTREERHDYPGTNTLADKRSDAGIDAGPDVGIALDRATGRKMKTEKEFEDTMREINPRLYE